MMNPEEMNERQMEEAFAHEFRALSQSNETIILALSPFQVFALLATVQLASRHPEAATSKMVQLAIEIVRSIQPDISTGPVLTYVAERGWHPESDVEETPY
jgi:hypothetical protein